MMETTRPQRLAFVAILLAATGVSGQTATENMAAARQMQSAASAQIPGSQTETDEYTRYELLAPETHRFRIEYEVTATRAGAAFFYNPIRKGSVATDEAVFDAMTGTPLLFTVVGGLSAKSDALMPRADETTEYIRVALARPVPVGGQARVRIVKTYTDAKSYYLDAGKLVFNRALGIQRNRIVLPAGYEVTKCTVPSQILQEPDGRSSISFIHAGTGEAPLVIEAIHDGQVGPGASPHPANTRRSWEAPFAGEPEDQRLSERAHQDRDIVYFLQSPETSTFELYHDYTESRSGVSSYVNVVRHGSVVSKPWAYVLDTGEALPTKIMSGTEMRKTVPDRSEKLDPKAQVVVISYMPVKTGESVRLRIGETYTAAASYRLDGDELVFDRSLGRPRNAVVLPAGWYVTASAEPATVSLLPDGRVRLDLWNDRPDAMDVLIKGRRRTQAR